MPIGSELLKQKAPLSALCFVGPLGIVPIAIGTSTLTTI